MAEEALATVRTPSTGTNAGKDDPVADGKLRDPSADLGDYPNPLMSENPANFHLGDIAFEDMEISAADRRRHHLHDHVG